MFYATRTCKNSGVVPYLWLNGILVCSLRWLNHILTPSLLLLGSVRARHGENGQWETTRSSVPNGLQEIAQDMEWCRVTCIFTFVSKVAFPSARQKKSNAGCKCNHCYGRCQSFHRHLEAIRKVNRIGAKTRYIVWCNVNARVRVGVTGPVRLSWKTPPTRFEENIEDIGGQ